MRATTTAPGTRAAAAGSPATPSASATANSTPPLAPGSFPSHPRPGCTDSEAGCACTARLERLLAAGPLVASTPPTFSQVTDVPGSRRSSGRCWTSSCRCAGAARGDPDRSHGAAGTAGGDGRVGTVDLGPCGGGHDARGHRPGAAADGRDAECAGHRRLAIESLGF